MLLLLCSIIVKDTDEKYIELSRLHSTVGDGDEWCSRVQTLARHPLTANVSYFPNPTVLPQLFQLRNLHRLEIFLSKWAKVPKVDDLPLIATWEWIHMTVASTTDIFAFLLNIVTCVTPAEHVLCKVISGANGTKNKTKIKMKINTRKTGSTQTCQGIIPLCLCLS